MISKRSIWQISYTVIGKNHVCVKKATSVWNFFDDDGLDDGSSAVEEFFFLYYILLLPDAVFAYTLSLTRRV